MCLDTYLDLKYTTENFKDLIFKQYPDAKLVRTVFYDGDYKLFVYKSRGNSGYLGTYIKEEIKE